MKLDDKHGVYLMKETPAMKRKVVVKSTKKQKQ